MNSIHLQHMTLCHPTTQTTTHLTQYNADIGNYQNNTPFMKQTPLRDINFVFVLFVFVNTILLHCSLKFILSLKNNNMLRERQTVWKPWIDCSL